MEIDPSTKKLFVHIPKTAGQSVFECIDDKWNRSFPMKHDPYFHLQRTNEIGSEVYKFCIVRNPYRRTFSYFRHWVNQVNSGEQPFEHFLKQIQKVVFYQSTPMYTYPQSFYVLNVDGEIERNLNIFRFENLKKLEDTIKIKLPHKNVGDCVDEDYYKAYTEKNILMVQKLFKVDFDNFNYEIDFK